MVKFLVVYWYVNVLEHLINVQLFGCPFKYPFIFHCIDRTANRDCCHSGWIREHQSTWFPECQDICPQYDEVNVAEMLQGV